MDKATTVRDIMERKISIPDYQRAYSWDTGSPSSPGQTDVFLSDLNESIKRDSDPPFFLGHFLFQQSGDEYHVIDGQQRLTTIVILLSALSKRLDSISPIDIKRFSTVGYDNDNFKKYIINKEDIPTTTKFKTKSMQRIIKAYEFFNREFKDKSNEYLQKMFKAITEAKCTSFVISEKAEAIQGFMFQNDRGKKPTELEKVKAIFMFHLVDNEKAIEEVYDKFARIYESISSIECIKIHEDGILNCALQVYCDFLTDEFSGEGSLNEIKKVLQDKDPKSLIEEGEYVPADSLRDSDGNPTPFILNFTEELKTTFEHLRTFAEDREKHDEIASIISLGSIYLILPFIVKAYKLGGSAKQVGKLCSSLESILIRHRLIGTRAKIRERIGWMLNEILTGKEEIHAVCEEIDYHLKERDEYWWSHWNNENLEVALKDMNIKHRIGKHILWKYENHLRKENGNKKPIGFNEIEQNELEHIAPREEPKKKPHGYNRYDKTFEEEYLNCIGNYLLIPLKINRNVSNKPFQEKLNSYVKDIKKDDVLEQQREITKEFLDTDKTWTKEVMKKRKNKIASVLRDIL